MKKVVMMMLVLLAQVALATENKKMTISAQQFKAEAKDYLATFIQNGELEDMDEECSMTIEHINEKDYVVLTTATGNKFRVAIESKMPVQLSSEEEEDGSFHKVYQFSRRSELRLTHLDDAYDIASLTNGKTTLVCGAYY